MIVWQKRIDKPWHENMYSKQNVVQVMHCQKI